MAIDRLPSPGAGIPTSTVTAKGDLIAGTANNAVSRLAVGADGTTLVADSTQSTGLKWGAAASSLTFSNTQTLAEQSTSSTSYTGLTTATAVTITTGTKALVIWGSQMKASGSPAGAWVTFDVSGATTSTGDDSRALALQGGDWSQASRHFVITGLTAGSNTFTLKFRSQSGSGATFDRRNITVIDLGS